MERLVAAERAQNLLQRLARQQQQQPQQQPKPKPRPAARSFRLPRKAPNNEEGQRAAEAKAAKAAEAKAVDARIASAIRAMEASFSRDTAGLTMTTRPRVKKLLLTWHPDKIQYHIASIPDATSIPDSLIRPPMLAALGKYSVTLTAALHSM